MSGSIAGITTRNTFLGGPSTILSVFDGESSFSIRLCHRQANKKHSRSQPTLPYPLGMSRREMISKFIHQTSSFVEIMLTKQYFNSKNF